MRQQEWCQSWHLYSASGAFFPHSLSCQMRRPELVLRCMCIVDLGLRSQQHGHRTFSSDHAPFFRNPAGFATSSEAIVNGFTALYGPQLLESSSLLPLSSGAAPPPPRNSSCLSSPSYPASPSFLLLPVGCGSGPARATCSWLSHYLPSHRCSFPGTCSFNQTCSFPRTCSFLDLSGDLCSDLLDLSMQHARGCLRICVPLGTKPKARPHKWPGRNGS